MIASRFLDSQQISCATWRGLAVSQKESYALRYLSSLFPRATILASQVRSLIAATDGYCELAVTRRFPLRPAGQAASLTDAASYFNGPTLLMAGLAFAAGYAACHYLAPPEPARPLPRRR